MLSEGYAWLVTDGMTGYEVPGQFEGLIGTSPATGDTPLLGPLLTVSHIFAISNTCQ